MKEKRVYRALVVLICILAILHAILAIALHTNWFRYGLSLEGLFALFILLPINFLIIGIGVYLYSSLRAWNLAWTRKIIAGFLIFTIFSSFYLYQSLPSFYLNDTQISDVSVLQSEATTLQYYLETQNTFSNSRKTYLHVTDTKTGLETVIKIPIDEPLYFTYSSPAIWGQLKYIQGSTYEFKFYALDTYLFRVNLQTKTVEMLEKKPTKTQRCFDEASDIFYTCPIETTYHRM